MRRELVEETGGFDPAFRFYEDWELWVNALAHGWRGVRVDASDTRVPPRGRVEARADRRQYRALAGAATPQAPGALPAQGGELASESDLGVAGRRLPLVLGPAPGAGPRGGGRPPDAVGSARGPQGG